ncbi:hypothetical protein LJD78_05455 [Bifidobacterium pseudolongum]|uniref:hypothetical protein n=1 Tax=Bifidobacterium pseudolongum TaxID=1694 RepID=UPI001D0B1428|nr:hypothetical protein [Bifidobacterium pseudolongum]UDL23177.1 hypothetical protein LJD78_05455 [Bifidobacterium pseudolongum]
MVGIRSISNARRLLAATACLCMALPLAACGSGASPAPTSTTTVAGETRLTGSVAMFLPNDVFTVSQDVPLNSWHDFADATTDSLEDRGFEADHVQTHADSDLERQSHRIQDYVVDALDGSTDGSSADPEAQSTTLVVAPAAPMTDTVKRYGDYVTQSLAEENATDESLDESLSRMTRALGLAQKAGMHVVVIATPLPGFTPDAFVSLCSAREIGRLQARQLVSKLQLDSASRYNPKYIEILLPYDADSDYPQLDEAFAREAFSGVWEVIGSYFRSGVVLSPSMKTTASTTAQDWRDVTIKATDADSIETEFRQRLGRPANGQGHVRIDGVIAMNDYVANGVVKGLTALKYTGSAADVNPSITIGDIVGNIAGRQDLQKNRVPDPKRAPSLSTPEGVRQENQKAQNRWPIVTGFGAYISAMPNIVNGKQWATGLVDRVASAADLARICAAFAQGDSLDGLDFVSMQDLYGQNVPTMSLPLLSVSAGNMKTELIDPGYITLAEAGL